MKTWPPSTWYSISVQDPVEQWASLSPDRKLQSEEPQAWPEPQFKKVK